MGHVAATVATTASFIGSADGSDAAALVKLVEEAARARLATEARNGANEQIVAAWQKWYAEARASVSAVAR
jgi:hypothetical protein